MISHNSNWLHCDVCVCAQTGEQKEHGYNRNFTRYIFFSKGVSHSTRSVQVNFRDFPHKTPFKCVSLMFHRPIGPLLGASSGGIRRNKYSYESVDDLRCTFKVKVMPLPLVSSEFKVQQVWLYMSCWRSSHLKSTRPHTLTLYEENCWLPNASSCSWANVSLISSLCHLRLICPIIDMHCYLLSIGIIWENHRCQLRHSDNIFVLLVRRCDYIFHNSNQFQNSQVMIRSTFAPAIQYDWFNEWADLFIIKRRNENKIVHENLGRKSNFQNALKRMYLCMLPSSSLINAGSPNLFSSISC